MQDAIIVKNLGKRFKRYAANRPMTWMEAAISRFQGVRSIEQFWALQQVSFTVAPGEMLGIIGHNGAGKSTLLQLLSGITRPDEGQVQVQGRIGALLDLGAGLHGDLTGRENLFALAIVAGLKRREVVQCFEEIVEFAELAAFIDNPVRTYSTGMMMRLAFAVAIHTRPQVLLVDEYLSVGDVAFQAKCLRRIAELKQQGCAIVLISHSVKQVQELCDRALWLSHGAIMAYGEPQVVAGQYNSAMQAQAQLAVAALPPQVTRSGTELRINENRFGSLAVMLTDVQLVPLSGRIQSGGSLIVEMVYESPKLVENPRFALSITRPDGAACVETNTDDGKFFVEQIEGTGRVRVRFDRLDLVAGEYFVNVGVFVGDWSYAYDYHWHVYPLIVAGSLVGQGVLSPPMVWSLAAKSTVAPS